MTRWSALKSPALRSSWRSGWHSTIFTLQTVLYWFIYLEILPPYVFTNLYRFFSFVPVLSHPAIGTFNTDKKIIGDKYVQPCLLCCDYFLFLSIYISYTSNGWIFSVELKPWTVPRVARSSPFSIDPVRRVAARPPPLRRLRNRRRNLHEN